LLAKKRERRSKFLKMYKEILHLFDTERDKSGKEAEFEREKNEGEREERIV
jgi:hypothetical protein